MSSRHDQNDGFPIAPIDEIIDEARRGRMFILTDAEDRENEGDLVFPAQFTTPETINFMAHFGCGLICLAMAPELIERLKLPMMTQNNGARFQTAFTISIEAREGVTTGISAADRAHTIKTAVDPRKSAEDIVSPGHMFPLKANPNGVLVRRGQTEGSVDIMRLAGLTPAAVICEVMKDDGTMARMADLVSFAHAHDMKIATIADLVAYRQDIETTDKVAIGS
jgi:3,4-dihydroxy 2-butanone 4-phosphate synthase / GTP cyclohydrolase II